MKWKMYELACYIWQKVGKINDCFFRGNADFSEWMSQEKAGFADTKGNRYQPSTDALIKVLRKFPISESDSILDIGCGKGKAMYLMSQFPFGKIQGYDLSETLVRIANQNFAKLDLKQCRAIQADAACFSDYDEFNYFYMFNALPQNIFTIMMEHIIESIQKKPRKVRFIYLNPVYHEYIVKETPFLLMYRKKSIINWFDYYCYENDI